jgi:putative transposase
MTSPDDLWTALQILDESKADSNLAFYALLSDMSATTLKRWRRQFSDDGNGIDFRKRSRRHITHHLSKEKHQSNQLNLIEPEFAAFRVEQFV